MFTRASVKSVMTALPKFDKPAVVTWLVKGPQGVDMPANQRGFKTLREAIWHVRTFPHGTRARMTIQCEGKNYSLIDIEELEREMRRR